MTLGDEADRIMDLWRDGKSSAEVTVGDLYRVLGQALEELEKLRIAPHGWLEGYSPLLGKETTE